MSVSHYSHTPLPRPAVNLDRKSLSLSQNQKFQTNSPECSPVSGLLPVSSPERKLGMRGDGQRFEETQRMHICAHLNTHRFIKPRVECSFPVWHTQTVCVCCDEHQGHMVDLGKHTSWQRHNKYGFSHSNFHILSVMILCEKCVLSPDFLWSSTKKTS